jgi:nucleoside-diphosphate-sugar epimerase
LKALVTGGAGFIGSAIVRDLVARQHEVFVFDNLSTGQKGNVPSGVELIEGDLRDFDSLQSACRGMEVVFHQGAVRSVPRSVDEPILVEQTNVLGTLHVLIAADAEGVRRVVYASSSSVYGDVQSGVNREDLPPNPLSPYAASKLAAEYYCRVWTALKELSTVSLRYFNVFGPGQPAESKYAAVFPAFASALVKGEPPVVHWDGEQSRDFTFIDDVVEANLRAAEATDEVSGKVINIAGGRSRTVNEVLRAVSAALGKWIEPMHEQKRSGDVRHTRADISLAAKLLAWKPRTDWDEAVRATARWFSEDLRSQVSSR